MKNTISRAGAALVLAVAVGLAGCGGGGGGGSTTPPPNLGGGISGTYTPGIAIEDGSFDNGDWSGVFDSSTEAHGTYSLEDSFDCPYEVAWTATSE